MPLDRGTAVAAVNDLAVHPALKRAADALARFLHSGWYTNECTKTESSQLSMNAPRSMVFWRDVAASAVADAAPLLADYAQVQALMAASSAPVYAQRGLPAAPKSR